MITSITINNERRAVVLELEDIATADFERIVMAVFACASRASVATPIEVREVALAEK